MTGLHNHLATIESGERAALAVGDADSGHLFHAVACAIRSCADDDHATTAEAFRWTPVVARTARLAEHVVAAVGDSIDDVRRPVLTVVGQ